MSNCPTCNKPVDSLRSRFVKVRDGKVVAYCSAEHMQEAETKPTTVLVPTRTPASGVVAARTPMLESGPVIEIIREPASTPVRAPTTPPPTTPPPTPDGSLDEWGSADQDDDAPERPSFRARTPLPVALGGKRTGLVIAVIAVLGAGGAYLAYRFLLMGNTKPTETAPDKPTPPPPPPVDAAVVKQVTAADAVVAARDTLVKNLGSDSPRVQRVAAAALARTGDEQAIKLLTAALAKETSDVSKLDLAYALARAGDKKGLDALNAGLVSPRTEVRAQAGRQLALVGDRRAIPVLSNYLEVSQRRLGAAEALAVLAEPAAIKTLDQIRGDANSSPDEKARATIALGLAGRSDMVPELQALLRDARFNPFAALALVTLRDPSAKPVLVEQLAVPSLRVDAARALRRLEPAGDPAPYLPALLKALDSHKDTEQVQVAEAILLLAGDAGWSEKP